MLGANQSGENLQQHRLADPTAPQQQDDFTCRKRAGRGVQQRALARLHSQVADLDAGTRRY